MVISTIEAQLVLHEGLRTDLYHCPGGYLTIGVGRNLEARGLSKEEQAHMFGETGLSHNEIIERFKAEGISKEHALYLLASDIAICKNDLQSFAWFDELDPIRQKVMIDMRFNLGATGFRQFRRMIKALEIGDYSKAAAEMRDSKWYHQVNVRSRRLVKMMITGEDYKT